MKFIQSGAVQLDADVCNNINPPVRGCHAGGGIHVAIPPDWAARILAGQVVQGCSYYQLLTQTNGDISLLVDDFAIGQLAIPAIVNGLSAPLKAQAGLLQAKLATAVQVAAVQA